MDGRDTRPGTRGICDGNQRVRKSTKINRPDHHEEQKGQHQRKLKRRRALTLSDDPKRSISISADRLHSQCPFIANSPSGYRRPMANTYPHGNVRHRPGSIGNHSGLKNEEIETALSESAVLRRPSQMATVREIYRRIFSGFRKVYSPRPHLS